MCSLVFAMRPHSFHCDRCNRVPGDVVDDHDGEEDTGASEEELEDIELEEVVERVRRNDPMLTELE